MRRRAGLRGCDVSEQEMDRLNSAGQGIRAPGHMAIIACDRRPLSRDKVLLPQEPAWDGPSLDALSLQFSTPASKSLMAVLFLRT
jgi:hypothetical protein